MIGAFSFPDLVSWSGKCPGWHGPGSICIDPGSSIFCKSLKFNGKKKWAIGPFFVWYGMSIREKLITLLEPSVEALGYELVELEARSNPKGGLIRLYIDGPNGIGLDDCEAVSHQVSGVLDVEDPMPGEYNLEVSSPGIDRPLRTPEHFTRFVGQRVKLELDIPREDGRWRFSGVLTGFADDTLELDVEGDVVQVERQALKRARLVPED